jgi:ubiquinone/menaquinone biosynthesis C-methylase UbiE
MNPKFENMLKKGMVKFGGLVESVIGHAKKAKGSVKKPAAGVQPILALESQLSFPKLKELANVSIERIVTPLIPNLVDKSSIELGEGETKFSALMKEKGSSVSIHVDISSSGGSYPKETKKSGVHCIRSDVKNIPVEDGFFDYVVANLATSKQGDIVKAIKEVGRVLTLGGKGIIVDFHPFGRFAKKGATRLRSMESIIRGIEDYYKICKVSGFTLNYIKEAFFDETVRKYFVTPEEKSAFRSVKDTPFLIFLAVSKQGR